MNKSPSPRLQTYKTRKEAQSTRNLSSSSSGSSLNKLSSVSNRQNSNLYQHSGSLSHSNSKTRNRKDLSTPSSKNRRFTYESLLEDPDCISLRNSLLSNDSPNFDDIETPQMLRLLSHLREHTQACALVEDYKNSKKSRDLANLVRSELTKRGTIHRSIQDQKDEIEARISDFEEKWVQKREDFNTETENRFNDLNNRQRRELYKFEQIWKKDMPHKYRKPSTRLLQLKQIEKSLAMTGEIDEADRIHGISEDRMRYEMEEAQNQLSTDYEAAKAKLFQKFEEERQTFFELRDHENNLLEASYRDEKAKFNNRNFVITFRCQKVASKTQVSKSVNSLPTTLPRDKGIPLGTLLPPLIPPNDPNYMENKRRKREEIARKKREFQKKNIDDVLAQFSTARSKVSQNSKKSQNSNNSHNVDEFESSQSGFLQQTANSIFNDLISGNDRNDINLENTENPENIEDQENLENQEDIGNQENAENQNDDANLKNEKDQINEDNHNYEIQSSEANHKNIEQENSKNQNIEKQVNLENQENLKNQHSLEKQLNLEIHVNQENFGEHKIGEHETDEKINSEENHKNEQNNDNN